jgi:hypothetical protein
VWKVPHVQLTVVGHFLRADFGRIHGRDFLEGLKTRYTYDSSRLVMRSRKLLEFVEQGARRTGTQPVLEYFRLAGEFYGARVQMRDTMLPYGPASLDSLSQIFLKVPKCGALGPEDKADMLRTFRERTADAYGYAVVDALNTLLVYEQMQAKDAETYRAFGFPEKEIPPLRNTLGSRVSTFLTATTLRTLAADSRRLPSERGLEALMEGGGVGLFEKRRVFETPEQRALLVKQWKKFEDRTGAGLEALAFRRTYGCRRQGSLCAVAEEVHAHIRAGGTNLTKLLNLNKLSDRVLAVTEPRQAEIKRRKAEALRRLRETIDSRNLPPEALPTAYLVTAEEVARYRPADEAIEWATRTATGEPAG